MLISGATIERSRAPIFLRVGSRGRLMPGMPPAKVGALRRIVIERIRGNDNRRQGSFISGIAGGLVEDVVIRRLALGMEGGGAAEMARASVNENEKGYPDAHQFSKTGLPAFGFFVRHARRIQFDDVKVTPALPDARPLLADGGHTAEILVDGQPVRPMSR